MRRNLIMLAVATLAIGCQKDNSESIIAPTSGRYTDALTINLGTGEMRGSFDSELKWNWSEGDEIIGYQNSGEKLRNRLSFEDGTTFSCDEFTYATTEPAKFHFVYPASAEQGDKTLVAPQDGSWNPILVGSTAETTLSEIGTVQMQHLTSALEIRSSGEETITAISLTSENEFLGSWSVNEDLSYIQNYAGNSLEVSGWNKASYVVNMPVLTADELNDKDITLSVTTSGGVTTSKKLSGMTFEAGKRTIINIREASTSTLDNAKFQSLMFDYFNDVNAIKFIVNSPETSSVEAQEDGKTPIYLVRNGSTLEIHTAAQKIMAPADCTQLFSNLTSVTSIDFSGFDTSNVTNMCGMFFYSTQLTHLDLSNFNTSKVETMELMFYFCMTTSIDLTSFDFENVTVYDNMFANIGFISPQSHKCTVLLSADGYNWANENKNNLGGGEICVFVGPGDEH